MELLIMIGMLFGTLALAAVTFIIIEAYTQMQDFDGLEYLDDNE